MNPAYALAVLTAAVYGSADFLGALATRRASAIVVTFVSGAAGLLTLAAGTLWIHGAPAPGDFAWAIGSGVCGALGIIALYRALALGPVSVAAPVISLTMLAVPVAVGVALGERPGPLALLGIALAAGAFPLLSHTGAREHAERARLRAMLRVAVASGVMLGGFLVCIRPLAPQAGLAPLVVARLTIVLVSGLILLGRRQPMRIPPAAQPATLVAGLCDSGANISYFFAVHGAPLAGVGTIVALSPAATLLLARVIMRERWTLPQQAGLVLAAAAIVCVSLG